MSSDWLIPLFSASILVIGLVCLVLFLRLRKYVQQQKALINVLRNELHAMTNSSIGMGRRLQDVEKKLNVTASKQQELENRDPDAVAYNQAARLMQMGANVEDLVRDCGIGRPEAELMALLHRELHADRAIGRDS
ncbi:DUF2802 domain-containing protein [Pontibacter sp. JAM-7]|uniref:DUF2802 domain-containing protein n=1 Tax=Pontibacter sp. JAM-7 TaxID=3366581 RepID=UPI003AF4944E